MKLKLKSRPCIHKGKRRRPRQLDDYMFIIVSYILLVAMVGAIVLTHRHGEYGTDEPLRQYKPVGIFGGTKHSGIYG